MVKFKRSQLTAFAKMCAEGAFQMLNGVCYAGDIIHHEIGRKLATTEDGELLLEVSRRFSRYARDQMGFDVETGEVQDFQSLIQKIVNSCEENDWFGN